MIHGVVSAGAPTISLTIKGERDSLDVEFLVDTGYTGFLSLPARMLDSIGANTDGSAFVSMADGTFRRVAVYNLTAEWDGDEREVEAVTLEDHPLVGYKMLAGYHLSIEVQEGGEVTIEAL